MKNLLIVLLIAALTYACGARQNVKPEEVNRNRNVTQIVHEPGDTIRIANEKLEYEIIIIENGFDSWLVTQKPMSYYTEPWLEQRNYQYVTEWNRRVSEPFRYNPNLYEQPIDYSPHIHYGLEVNYLLYMYFKFFEQKYRQKLLPYVYNR